MCDGFESANECEAVEFPGGQCVWSKVGGECDAVFSLGCSDVAADSKMALLLVKGSVVCRHAGK